MSDTRLTPSQGDRVAGPADRKSSEARMRPLYWIAVVLAALHVFIGVGMAVVGNSEGRVGGVLYALMYALPLVLIALALRSSKRRRRATAGWAALLLGVFYSAVVAGNWSGYSTPKAIFMVSVTAPTVAVTLAGFWATVLNRSPSRVANPPARAS